MQIIDNQDLLAVDWLDYKGVTTNDTIKKDGCLVMGRGFAWQVRDAIPGFDYEAGQRIIQFRKDTPLIPYKAQDYEVLWFSSASICSNWFLFQVKRSFRDPADLDLIARSTKRLRDWALVKPKWMIGLNFPGVGYGRLNVKDVLPLVEILPENVFLFKRDIMG